MPPFASVTAPFASVTVPFALVTVTAHNRSELESAEYLDAAQRAWRAKGGFRRTGRARFVRSSPTACPPRLRGAAARLGLLHESRIRRGDAAAPTAGGSQR